MKSKSTIEKQIRACWNDKTDDNTECRMTQMVAMTLTWVLSNKPEKDTPIKLAKELSTYLKQDMIYTKQRTGSYW